MKLIFVNNLIKNIRNETNTKKGMGISVYLVFWEGRMI